MRSLVWFRRDLRVADNLALSAACRASDNGVVAVFAITSDQWQDHDDAPVKVDFWLRNLRSLRESLEKLQIPLLIIQCKSFAELPRKIVSHAKKHQCEAIYLNREYEVNEVCRDDAVQAKASEAGLELHQFHDRVIIAPDQIFTKEDKYYTVFTPYRRVWDTRIGTSADCLSKPSKQCPTGIDSSKIPEKVSGFDFSDLRSDLWPEGEKEAQKRLKSFSSKISDYSPNRDIPSVNGTSVLSPYLAAGVISPRQCLKMALEASGGDLTSNPGAQTWVSELTWRDFYTAVLVGFPRVSKSEPFKLKTRQIQWRYDRSDFEAWCNGQTGYPIVDAGMRQLNRTGWMHNRLRMVTAMFLTKHLLIDWRWGEQYFMEHLIDGDLAANNGGWQWSASTGTDSVPYFRIFNPFSQSQRFDPEAKYIKKFCPELEEIKPAALHDPKKLEKELSAKSIDYPDFIVDHREARQRALDEFKRNA